MGRPASSTYLLKRYTTYYFRIAVPFDLQGIVVLREIRYSLGTGKYSVAKVRALQFASFILALFDSLRGSTMKELSNSEIQRLIKKHFREILERDERERVNAPRPKTLEECEREHNEYFVCKQAYESYLMQSDYSHADRAVKRILQDNNIELPPDSESYRKLAREYTKATLTEMDVLMARMNGDYKNADVLAKTFDNTSDDSDKGSEALPPSLPVVTPQTDDTAAGSSVVMIPPVQDATVQDSGSKRLGELITLYVEDRTTEGKWRPKTQDEFRACLAMLLEYFGDVPVDTITYEKMRKYRETLRKLPKNRIKGQYKDMSLEEIVKTKVDEPMSISNVNKYLSRSSSLFNYAVRHDFMRKNPAVGMEIQQEKKDHELRDRFSQGDLNKLFGAKEYLVDSHPQSYCFWLPILGLYTGCRLDELCQLHLDDIREINGVWVLDINDKEEKKIKSKAGKRLIPLHPVLISELGFAAYAENLRQKGEKRLFPELSLRRDGYGQTASKWFQRYRARCGVGDAGKVFHSFRHTFDDTLKQNLVNDSIISELMGHSDGSLALRRYADPFRPELILKEAIMKLDFGVDLSHLKKSKYVAAGGSKASD